MTNVLLVIHLMLAMAMIVAVLLQRSEGGGLGIGGGAGGGMGSFLSGRGTANLLTRTTAILAAGFMLTSLSLTILAASGRAPRSILDQVPVTGTPAPGTTTTPAPAEEQPARPTVPVQ